MWDLEKKQLLRRLPVWQWVLSLGLVQSQKSMWLSMDNQTESCKKIPCSHCGAIWNCLSRKCCDTCINSCYFCYYWLCAVIFIRGTHTERVKEREKKKSETSLRINVLMNWFEVYPSLCDRKFIRKFHFWHIQVAILTNLGRHNSPVSPFLWRCVKTGACLHTGL